MTIAMIIIVIGVIAVVVTEWIFKAEYRGYQRGFDTAKTIYAKTNK